MDVRFEAAITHPTPRPVGSGSGASVTVDSSLKLTARAGQGLGPQSQRSTAWRIRLGPSAVLPTGELVDYGDKIGADLT